MLPDQHITTTLDVKCMVQSAFPDLTTGIFFAAFSCPPAVEVVMQGLAADEIEAVAFGQSLNSYNCFAHSYQLFVICYQVKKLSVNCYRLLGVPVDS